MRAPQNARTAEHALGSFGKPKQLLNFCQFSAQRCAHSCSLLQLCQCHTRGAASRRRRRRRRAALGVWTFLTLEREGLALNAFAMIDHDGKGYIIKVCVWHALRSGGYPNARDAYYCASVPRLRRRMPSMR